MNIIDVEDILGKTENNNEDKRQKADKNGGKKAKWYVWPITITLVTFILSIAFSLSTELAITNTQLVVAVFVLLILIFISIVFDIIGIAVTACEIAPLTSMAARKIRGSRHAIKLVHNADRVSSICADVIGDICGIVSGACGAAIAFMIIARSNGSELVISVIISALIASVTVGGKAVMKKIAINHAAKIVVLVGKFLSLFKKEGKR